MHGAARSGHLDLVEFFIGKGANDLDTGMYIAALNGHRHIVEFFRRHFG
jgi:ankyrin repeat protein